MQIAEAFLAKDRDGALARAEAIRDEACRDGKIARADLFVAVCSFLNWRAKPRPSP